MAKKHAYVVQREDVHSRIYYAVLVEGSIVHTANTQKEAADWAIAQGYAVHVARVRHLEDVDTPNHWRDYP